MNTYSVNDVNFTNSELYQNYLRRNPGIGYLMIRASAAGGAIPISNLDVTVSNMIGDTKVIFFNGKTDSSGMIEKISLPAPPDDQSDLEVPVTTIYDVEAVYDGKEYAYKVNMYNGIFVLQNINIVPKVLERTDYYGY